MSNTSITHCHKSDRAVRTTNSLPGHKQGGEQDRLG
jgi:hypothetical protein